MSAAFNNDPRERSNSPTADFPLLLRAMNNGEVSQWADIYLHHINALTNAQIESGVMVLRSLCVTGTNLFGFMNHPDLIDNLRQSLRSAGLDYATTAVIIKGIKDSFDHAVKRDHLSPSADFPLLLRAMNTNEACQWTGLYLHHFKNAFSDAEIESGVTALRSLDLNASKLFAYISDKETTEKLHQYLRSAGANLMTADFIIKGIKNSYEHEVRQMKVSPSK